jgi:hypothetical protein
LQPFDRPRIRSKNIYVRRRRTRSSSKSFPLLIVAAVPSIAVIVIYHLAGVLMAIGIMGAALAIRLAPAVGKRLKMSSPRAGKRLYLIWLIVTLALCVSFIHTSAVFASHGKAWALYTSTEFKRTVLAAVIFCICIAGIRLLHGLKR